MVSVPIDREPSYYSSKPSSGKIQAQVAQVLENSNGNFVVEVPVPNELLNACQFKEEQEFTHLRYTACTVEPDHVSKSGYTLRQQKLQRQTEVFIVVTMVWSQKLGFFFFFLPKPKVDVNTI
jgi:chitin synthase